MMAGFCPFCGGGPVKNTWGMAPGMMYQCLACGHTFDSLARMREMDQAPPQNAPPVKVYPDPIHCIRKALERRRDAALAEIAGAYLAGRISPAEYLQRSGDIWNHWDAMTDFEAVTAAVVGVPYWTGVWHDKIADIKAGAGSCPNK